MDRFPPEWLAPAERTRKRAKIARRRYAARTLEAHAAPLEPEWLAQRERYKLMKSIKPINQWMLYNLKSTYTLYLI